MKKISIDIDGNIKDAKLPSPARGKVHAAIQSDSAIQLDSTPNSKARQASKTTSKDYTASHYKAKGPAKDTLARRPEIAKNTLRPSTFDAYIGQKNIKKNLNVSLKACQKQGKMLDHTLFYGPPGLGKTTLSYLIASSLNTSLRVTAAPMISKSGDLAALLTNVQENEVLFIDEIHRLSPAIEEVLYSAMEDFRLDIIIGSGPAAQSVKIDLPPFTLVGATTRVGLLSAPLRDRFGLAFRLEFYSIEELASIIRRADIYKIDKDAALSIAARSRGTPRIALKLCKRVSEYAIYKGLDRIDSKLASFALDELGITSLGFDAQDLAYLKLLLGSNIPLGLSTIAATLLEDETTIEDVIEPYLLANNYIIKTPKGRQATLKAASIYNEASFKS